MDKESFNQMAMAAAYVSNKALELIKKLEKEIVIYKNDFDSNIEAIGSIYRKEEERLKTIDLSQVSTEELVKELKKRKEPECIS